MIKPNVTSWRHINVSNAFNVALKMNDDGNRYGIESTTDTHMMKNSEWAIVAYLSQSKYGKLGNTNFTGTNKEIYQNKSDQYITGCSYGAPSNNNIDYGCQYTYDVNINGTGASTTGNIYGIYDMSGGSWEYVMGNYNDMMASSGFEIMPNLKYYDKYTSNNLLSACNGKECISHALSETAGWYNDEREMINETYPWFIRGINLNNSGNQGIFVFVNGVATGTCYGGGSFRLVLTTLS